MAIRALYFNANLCLLDLYSMASYFTLCFSFYSIHMEEWDFCIIIIIWPALHCKAIKFQQYATAAVTASNKKMLWIGSTFLECHLKCIHRNIYNYCETNCYYVCERCCSFSILRIYWNQIDGFTYLLRIFFIRHMWVRVCLCICFCLPTGLLVCLPACYGWLIFFLCFYFFIAIKCAAKLKCSLFDHNFIFTSPLA